MTSRTSGVTRASSPAASISSGPIPFSGERAPRAVVSAAEFACLLDRRDVARLLDDAQHRSVALEVEQISHGSSFRQRVADQQRRTDLRLGDRARKPLRFFRGSATVVRQARGALAADPGSFWLRRQTFEDSRWPCGRRGGAAPYRIPGIMPPSSAEVLLNRLVHAREASRAGRGRRSCTSRRRRIHGRRSIRTDRISLVPDSSTVTSRPRRRTRLLGPSALLHLACKSRRPAASSSGVLSVLFLDLRQLAIEELERLADDRVASARLAARSRARVAFGTSWAAFPRLRRPRPRVS